MICHALLLVYDISVLLWNATCVLQGVSMFAMYRLLLSCLLPCSRLLLHTANCSLVILLMSPACGWLTFAPFCVCQRWGTYSCCITPVHRESFLLVALQAAAACSVFLGTISPTAAVPHTTRRRSSFGLAATLAGVSSEDLAEVSAT